MPSKGAQDNGHRCCGVVQEAVDEARAKKAANTKGQPWIVLKLMVPLTVGIMGYAAYVYIGRFCLDMIKGLEGAEGSRGTGIVYLVVFAILLLWTVWAYIKVVVTSPGYAKDYVLKSSRPMFPEPPQPVYNPNDYDPEYPYPSLSQPPSPSRGVFPEDMDRIDDSQTVGGPAYEHIDMHSYQKRAGGGSPVTTTTIATTSARKYPDPRHQQEGEPNAEVLDALPLPTASTPVTEDESVGHDERAKLKRPRSVLKKQKKPSVYVSRRPPQTPQLLPEHRYCGLDEIVKPYRTHHCRTCGTCVLKYDHHCPWIGQCVGARNHKFFLNFVQAASISALYTLATLLPYTIRASSSKGLLDPQRVVVIGLAGLFGFFTISLQIVHIHLIWRGQTTVENMQARDQKERESIALNKAFGFCGIVEKRRMRQQWEREWGSISKEGNIWWLGSGRDGWVDVMGTNPMGWLLPIGKSMNDGLTYAVNPRFDAEGRWRRRTEWPKEVR